MLKIIKKSFKYLAILIGIIFVIPTFMSLLILIPEVQTFIVKRITDHLSNEIKATITVGQFDYKFFNKLSLSDLLIKDQNNDTLIYSSRIEAGIRKINFRDKSFKLGKISLNRPYVALITDSAGHSNLKWYLQLLKGSDTTGKGATRIVINSIDISDAGYIMKNQTAERGKMPVDFGNLRLKNINARIEDFALMNDSLIFSIQGLSFKESCGFTVKDFNSDVTISGNNIIFTSALIKCDTSLINAREIGLYPDTLTLSEKFTDKVKLNIILQQSFISASDLKYFVRLPSHIDESVWLSGKITGTVSELKGRNIEMKFGNRSILNCDFDFSGLPDIDNTFIFIRVNSLKTDAGEFETLNLAENKPVRIPEFLYKLGNISFEGSFTGFTSDFVTYGRLSTERGVLRTDVSLRPEDNSRFRVQGLLSGTEIDLGEISGNTELLGKITFNANVSGYAESMKEFSGNVTGTVDSVEIKKYFYRKIDLNGSFTEKTWDGSIKISDENVRMDLLGMFNFREDLPEFDFTLNLAKADLFKLNIDEADSSSYLTLLMTANFRGNNIDNLDGEIRLLNSTIRKYNNRLDLYDFSLRTFIGEGKPSLSLRTDFIDADLQGYYSFSSLKTMIRSAMASVLPSVYEKPDVVLPQRENNFTFNINFKNTDKLNSFFRTGISLAEKSSLQGMIVSDTLLIVNGRAKKLGIKSFSFDNFALDASYTGNRFSGNFKSDRLGLIGQTELRDLKTSVDLNPDNFVFSILWDNHGKPLNKGRFEAKGLVGNYDNEKSNPFVIVNIESSDVFSNDRQWKINSSTIRADTSSVEINRFIVNNNDNYYLVDGRISGNPADSLNIEFNGIDLSSLGKAGEKRNVKNQSSIPLELKGILSGNLLLTDIFRNLMFESKLKITDFSLLGSDYGEINASSVWNSSRKVAEITANNNLKGSKMLDIKGIYDPEVKRINLDVLTKKLPLDALNPLLGSFASEISGLASGKLNLSGELRNLVLKGSVFAESASMKINYLQTRYRLNDSIRFNKNSIIFRNIRLTDERGNFATLSGSVNHNYFKDYKPDLTIGLKETLALNTKPKDNDIFYGTAFATGVTTIKGRPGILSFDISARTGKNTKFYIPLNTSMSASDYSFVTFVAPDTVTSQEKVKTQKEITENETSDLELNFDLEVTPDAEVQLIIDSKAGDVMKAHGAGNLNIVLNPKGIFQMFGDYIIEDGDYLFTLGNILNKSFTVENGGRISFNGDIENAEIDIKAIYRLKASLYELLQDPQFSERIPVECQLNLTGKLFNPIVGFNIFLPNADEETRTFVRNAITSEEELSRQFLYLLVMNSFYAEPSYRSPLATNTGTSAMAVTTTEMLSNQLSNWLSQISNDFDLDFVYRPGYKDVNSQELEVALSTQLLNDKVLINGNFDVRGTSNSYGNPITGDFDIEYKLTEKIRFRVFNRFNNPYTGKGVPYTQGLGIFFKQDFNRLSDLFRKRPVSDMKKEEETTLE